MALNTATLQLPTTLLPRMDCLIFVVKLCKIFKYLNISKCKNSKSITQICFDCLNYINSITGK